MERGEFLHEPALAPGGIVLVQDAFFRGFIQSADGLECRRARLVGVVGLGDGFPRRANSGASPSADGSVANALARVGAHTFNSGSGVSQFSLSWNTKSNERSGILLEAVAFV